MACDKIIEQFSAYLDGELTAEETEAVRAHLESCAPCRRELEELRRTAKAVSELPRVSAPAGLRAKVLAGIERAEPEAAESRRPRWRMFWGAAAALLIAAVLMLLNLSPKSPPATSTGPAFARASEPRSVSPAPDWGDEPAPPGGNYPGAAAPMPATPSLDEAGRSGEREAAVAKRDGEASLNAAGKDFALASKGADAAKTLAAETPSEEIVLPSADPQAAFGRVRALAEERGWLAPESVRALLADRARPEPDLKLRAQNGAQADAVPKMVLRLRRSQEPQLKDALAKAGLFAAAESKFGGRPPAAMKPPAPGLQGAGGGAMGPKKETNELPRLDETAGPAEGMGAAPSAPATTGMGAPPESPASPGPATPVERTRVKQASPPAPPSPAAVATPPPAMPAPNASPLGTGRGAGEAAGGAARKSAKAALEKGGAGDEFVQIVLVFPRAEPQGRAAEKAEKVGK